MVLGFIRIVASARLTGEFLIRIGVITKTLTNPTGGSSVTFSSDVVGTAEARVTYTPSGDPNPKLCLYQGTFATGFSSMGEIYERRYPIDFNLYFPPNGQIYEYSINYCPDVKEEHMRVVADKLKAQYGMYGGILYGVGGLGTGDFARRGMGVLDDTHVPTAVTKDHYTVYKNQPLGITGDTDVLVPKDTNMGILLPGGYELDRDPSFSIVSDISIPNSSSIGYTTSAGVVRFTSLKVDPGFKVAVVMANFYSNIRGNTYISVHRTGGPRNEYVDTLATIKTALDTVGKGNSTIDTDVGTVSLV